MDDADTKGQKFSQTMSTMGGVTAIAGVAGIAAVSAASVKLATDFQSTVASIASSAGISISAAQSIGQAFLDTGGSTIYRGKSLPPMRE